MLNTKELNKLKLYKKKKSFVVFFYYRSQNHDLNHLEGAVTANVIFESIFKSKKNKNK